MKAQNGLHPVDNAASATYTSVHALFAAGEWPPNYYRQAVTRPAAVAWRALDAERWVAGEGASLNECERGVSDRSTSRAKAIQADGA